MIYLNTTDGSIKTFEFCANKRLYLLRATIIIYLFSWSLHSSRQTALSVLHISVCFVFHIELAKWFKRCIHFLYLSFWRYGHWFSSFIFLIASQKMVIEIFSSYSFITKHVTLQRLNFAWSLFCDGITRPFTILLTFHKLWYQYYKLQELIFSLWNRPLNTYIFIQFTCCITTVNIKVKLSGAV